MASAELVGITFFAHGPFGRASVQSCGLILGVSYPNRPPCRPTWSDQQSWTSRCTCCPAPLCQGVSVGFIQLDGGADGQQNKMPHVPLFAKPLSHTMIHK